MVGSHECHLKAELWPGWRSTHQPPSGGNETASLVSSSSLERGESVPRVTQPSRFFPRTVMECKYLEILWLFSTLQGTEHTRCIPKARQMSPASEDPWPARIKGKKQSDKGPFLLPPAILCLLVFVRHSLFSGPKCPLHGGRWLSIWRVRLLMTLPVGRGWKRNKRRKGKGLEMSSWCPLLHICLRVADDMLQSLCSLTIGSCPLPDKCELGGDRTW